MTTLSSQRTSPLSFLFFCLDSHRFVTVQHSSVGGKDVVAVSLHAATAVFRKLTSRIAWLMTQASEEAAVARSWRNVAVQKDYSQRHGGAWAPHASLTPAFSQETLFASLLSTKARGLPDLFCNGSRKGSSCEAFLLTSCEGCLARVLYIGREI